MRLCPYLMSDQSVTTMISASEAETLIRARMPGFATEQRPIDRAGGAILRQRIIAERDSRRSTASA